MANNNGFHLQLICLLALMITTTEVRSQSEGVGKPIITGPPQLKRLVDDDFETDSRNEFSTKGDVEWVPGYVKLGPNASLKRQIDAEGWVEMEIDLVFPDLVAKSNVPVLVVWLESDGNRDSYVRFRKLGSDNARGEIEILQTSSNLPFSLGDSVVRAVKTDMPNGQWRIRYRWGYWRVFSPDKELVLAAVTQPRSSKPVLAIQSNLGNLELRALDVACDQKLEIDPESFRILKSEIPLASNVYQLFRSGKSKEALPIAEQFLATRKTVLGDFHFDTIMGHHNVAAQHRVLGNFADAEQHFTRAHDLAKATLGDHHPQYADCVHELAMLFSDMGVHERARPLYQQALEIFETAFGEFDSRYVKCLRGIAMADKALGAVTRAETAMIEAVRLSEQFVGSAGIEHASALSDLASVRKELGDYEQAESGYQQAIQSCRRAAGTKNLNYAEIANQLAMLYDEVGLYEQAKPLYLESMQIRKTVVATPNSAYASSLNNLAMLYAKTGNFEEAKKYAVLARDTFREVYSEKSPVYAKVMGNLGLIHMTAGDFENAESALVKALEIYESIAGKNGVYYAQALGNLATFRAELGRFEGVEQMHLDSLAILESTVGKMNPLYAYSFSNLAIFYTRKQDYAKAEKYYRQSLLETRHMMNRFALIYSESQQLTNASHHRVLLDGYLKLVVEEKTGLHSDVYSETSCWKGATLIRQSAVRDPG